MNLMKDVPMTNRDQPRGAFRFRPNDDKIAGDKLPAFTNSTISSPSNPAATFDVSLWEHTDVRGDIFWAGTSSQFANTASALDIARGKTERAARSMDSSRARDGSMTLEDNSVMVFKNQYKLAKDSADYAALSSEQKIENDKLYDVYGYWKPAGEPQCIFFGRSLPKRGRMSAVILGDVLVQREKASVGAQQPIEPLMEERKVAGRSGR